MNTEYLFYDTCSLLLNTNHLFDNKNQRMVISSITLQELEEIKTSKHKDEDLKQSARRLLRELERHQGEYDIHLFQPLMAIPLEVKGFTITNDLKILATAIDYDKNLHPDETVFITNDLALKQIANLFFGEDSIWSVNEEELDNYTGYVEVTMSDEQLAKFYENPYDNFLNLLVNQYLIIKSPEGEVLDTRRWDGYSFRALSLKPLFSRQFGPVKPMKGDIYQMFALDSLSTNEVTMLCGKPGSGKTYLAFGYLFDQLEKGKLDRIIVFCNPVVAKNAAKLGYYPGTPFEKLMGSQVGAVLSSKLGDETEVQKLVAEGKLVLVPAGDARGYEVPHHSGVYIMESQNLTCDLLRMLLQRISTECKVIVDGDYNEQVDMDIYAGNNNGMRKMSQVFRGNGIYGQVELKNIHRSHIAAIADNMK